MNNLTFIVFASILPLASLTALAAKLMIQDFKPGNTGKTE